MSINPRITSVLAGLIPWLICAQTLAATPVPVPEFTARDASSWVSSEPLRRSNLRGKVVLLDIWPFECWNCYRSFPWLNSVEERFGPRGLLVIGIHSPEFSREQDRSAVAAKARELGLRHPVMIDNDFRYWKAIGNRVWPAFYLVDKRAGSGTATSARPTRARPRPTRSRPPSPRCCPSLADAIPTRAIKAHCVAHTRRLLIRGCRVPTFRPSTRHRKRDAPDYPDPGRQRRRRG